MSGLLAGLAVYIVLLWYGDYQKAKIKRMMGEDD